MFLVKCDECKATLRATESLGESAAGGVCGECRTRAVFAEGFDAGYERGKEAPARSGRMSPPEYFWRVEFKFDLRDATRGEQEAVRVCWLAQRLELGTFTERHVEVVELVLGRESEARRMVAVGHVAYDQPAAAVREP